MKEKHHIISYRTYIFVLIALLILTGLSVAVTSIELGPFTVFTALLLASIKTILVLLIFMHLRFDQTIYKIMVGGVLFIFAAVLIVTFFDYLYR